MKKTFIALGVTVPLLALIAVGLGFADDSDTASEPPSAQEQDSDSKPANAEQSPASDSTVDSANSDHGAEAGDETQDGDGTHAGVPKPGAPPMAGAAVPTVSAVDGRAAFVDVASVLHSPRCMNCHPAGDVPLQGDFSVPHAQNISRQSEDAGLQCGTCHGAENSEFLGIFAGPPGAPNWHLPPPETPMIFEGLTPKELCEQLKRPADTGGLDLPGLLHHVTHDPLVLWGWDPGGNRTVPPLDHATFVARFETWVNSGGECPE